MSDPVTKNFPQPTVETAPYWEGCRHEKLLLQQCTACGHFQFYPRLICTACMSDQLNWKQSGGGGHIVSFSVVRRAISAAYADEVPYVVALVELEEGPTMMSNLVDCAPEDACIGMQVQVIFDKWSEDITVPKFRPAD
jgi:uncharacterized OB-fold protein